MLRIESIQSGRLDALDEHLLTPSSIRQHPSASSLTPTDTRWRPSTPVKVYGTHPIKYEMAQHWRERLSWSSRSAADGRSVQQHACLARVNMTRAAPKSAQDTSTLLAASTTGRLLCLGSCRRPPHSGNSRAGSDWRGSNTPSCALGVQLSSASRASCFSTPCFWGWGGSKSPCGSDVVTLSARGENPDQERSRAHELYEMAVSFRLFTKVAHALR